MTEQIIETTGSSLQPGFLEKRYGDHRAEISSSNMTSYHNHLTGQMLTLVEASFTDLQQRNAVKALVKQMIWSNYEQLQLWMAEQKDGKASSFPF